MGSRQDRQRPNIQDQQGRYNNTAQQQNQQQNTTTNIHDQQRRYNNNKRQHKSKYTGPTG